MSPRLAQIREILDHPANRAKPLATLAKYVRWNVGRRLLDAADYAIHMAPNAQIILSNRENYATLAYTCGLYDYDEMCFLTNYLRPNDVFGDFGANVGVYSVLAGSVGADILAVEPVSDTFARLERNLRLNRVGGEAVQCGLSDTQGTLRFTSSQSGLNHVARPNDTNTIEVAVRTGDELAKSTGLKPTVLKIDVEGFELPLLRGCSNLLRDVVAIVIELNGSGMPYGYSDDDVEALLTKAGFCPYDYFPEERELRQRTDRRVDRFNTLFVNQAMLCEVRDRIFANTTTRASVS